MAPFTAELERLDAQRDLLDEVRVLQRPPAGHERDLVVGARRVGAEERHHVAGLRERHAHEVAIERRHAVEVLNVDADVSQPGDASRHVLLLSQVRHLSVAAQYRSQAGRARSA